MPNEPPHKKVRLEALASISEDRSNISKKSVIFSKTTSSLGQSNAAATAAIKVDDVGLAIMQTSSNYPSFKFQSQFVILNIMQIQ